MPEVRERDDGVPADAQQIFEHRFRRACRLDGEGQDGEVERLIRIVRKIAIRVALDHRQAALHAQVDLLARQLDTTRVHALGLGQRACSSAPSPQPTSSTREARRHHLRDEEVIGPLLAREGNRFLHQVCETSLGRRAAPRKPRTVAWNSGSSSRNASWPLSLSISTNDTLAATAFRAWTMALLSRVG